MPKLYKKLIDIIALLCLAAVFLFTFSYLKSWWTEEIGEKRQEQNIWKEKRTGTVGIRKNRKIPHYIFRAEWM